MKRKLPKLSLFLASLSLVWEPGFGQDLTTSRSFASKAVNESISVQEKREPLQAIFKELESYFKVNIIFEDNSIKGQYSFVDIAELQQLTVEEALEQIVTPLGLVYKKIDERNFVVKQKTIKRVEFQPEIKSLPGDSTILVKGHVSDAATAEPLPGVTVQLKGSSKGTITDTNGDYSIVVPSVRSILIYSFLGFKQREITVGQNDKINLALEMDSRLLNEVQVVEVGYGTQKREAVAGAVATISNKQVQQMPTINLSSSLTGNTPGLIVRQRNGSPDSKNETSTVLIRTTSGFATPLIVVDGVPRASTSSQVGIDNIDPNDVESVTVLKDIASTAVYGARGANGVILITTKRGKESPTKFNFSTAATFSQPTQLPNFVDGYMQAVLENERAANSGTATPYSDTDLEMIKNNSNPDRFGQTNWAAQGLKEFSNGQNYNLNVSGGTDKVKYYLGGGLNQQKSLLKIDNDFKRYTFISNLDAKIAKNLNVSADINYRSENSNAPYAGYNSLFSSLFSQSPLQPVTFSNGLPAAFLTSATNPIYQAQNGGYRLSENNYFTGRFKAKLTIPFVKGLSVEGMASIDRSNLFGKDFFTPYKLYRADANGNYNPVTGVDSKGNDLKPTLNESVTKANYITMNFSLNYARAFGKHNLGALFLYESTETKTDVLSAGRTNIFSNNSDQMFAGDASITNNGSASESGRLGYVGRLNYSYSGKYYLEGSFRYEASTNFPVDHRWGFFPSVSGAWRISEEGFIKNKLSFLNDLKLRASYGMAGDENGAGFGSYLAAYSVSSNATNSTTGSNGYIWNGSYNSSVYAGTTTINPNFTWAKVQSYNLGLDFNLWKGLLSGEFDVYRKEAYDLLTPMFASSATVPLSFGAIAPKQNEGRNHTNGIELTLTHRNQVNKNFNYYVSGNISKAKTIVDFSGEAPGLPEWDINRYNGLSPNTDRFYKSLGLFQSQEEIDAWPLDQDGQKNKTIKPGDIKYADLNGDGILDSKDVYVVDNSYIPIVNYAINLGLTYKRLSLDMAFVGIANYTNNNLRQTWANFDERQLDRWTVDNPNASWPRLSSSANNSLKSDFYGMDGSYFRLRSAQLTYSVPANFINRLGIDALSIYVQGGNLLTFSKVKFMDPETFATSYYGPQKTFAMGVNLKF